VVTSKGPLSKYVQEVIGDVIMNSDAETFWAIEIKTEQENRHHNFFLETWSNKNLDDKRSHAERGSNPGWLLKLRADVLFYYFLASDDLFIIDLFKLKRWAFGCNEHQGKIWEYDEKLQGKSRQMNDTWGRCVPICVIRKEVGLTRTKVAQLQLFNEEVSLVGL
jgi:hypothetical protein